MKGYNKWSYAPYKPLINDGNNIYINRVVPSENAIHFEWLNIDGEKSVFYKKRDDTSWILYKKTTDNECDILDLETNVDYNFKVTTATESSPIRIARTGKAVGVVVNYLHPDDMVYAFSGRYLCSPSFVRHPDGYLLSSMDVFACHYPQNLTLIFRSDDEGKTWHYVSELMPCFWAKLFIHKNELYAMACSTEYGDLLIGKSTDGGKTFTTPTTLLRGSNGKAGNDGIHKNPQPPLIYNGRLYQTLEWGSWDNKDFCHAAIVASIDENADLLDAENWSFTPPKQFDPSEVSHLNLPKCSMTIEGTLVVAPDGKLLNVLRFAGSGHAICYEIDTTNPDAPLKFYGLINFPAHLSKFTIKYDEKSGYYYSVATKIHDKANPTARNLLSLLKSKNLVDWQTVKDIYDYTDCDPKYTGFQYVDYEFNGEDIIFVCRTALNNPNDYHNSNYQTFDIIKDFRNL
jgi:hypothetical protein